MNEQTLSRLKSGSKVMFSKDHMRSSWPYARKGNICTIKDIKLGTDPSSGQQEYIILLEEDNDDIYWSHGFFELPIANTKFNSGGNI